MQDTPSRTALSVALRRAAHQLYDAPPLVFPDPIAVRILGPHADRLARTPGQGRRPSLRPRAHSFALRAFLVARSRYAEDLLAQAVTRGTTQYILLGAGLDTFAHRSPYPSLHVYEIDHPATQAWKRDLLTNAGLPHPDLLTYVPTNFESQTLTQALLHSGLDPTRPAFVSWLGVVPYLTLEAFRSTLTAIAAFAPGSALVFDYGLPHDHLTGPERLAADSLAARVRAAGEPFQLFFTPAQIAAELRAHGFTLLEDLDGAAINARYLNHRPDTLRVLPTSAHLLAALHNPVTAAWASGGAPSSSRQTCP
jgi:methyltransferase (TIGR00027 family)